MIGPIHFIRNTSQHVFHISKEYDWGNHHQQIQYIDEHYILFIVNWLFVIAWKLIKHGTLLSTLLTIMSLNTWIYIKDICYNEFHQQKDNWNLYEGKEHWTARVKFVSLFKCLFWSRVIVFRIFEITFWWSSILFYPIITLCVSGKATTGT